MRPDPYKQKKSRRYQLTHKNKLENKDKQNVKEKAINNNDTDNNSNKIEKPKPRFNKKANKSFIDEETGKSYGRRKIVDNSYRYNEPTYEEQLEAEADIDVAVEDALSLINAQDNNVNYDPSSYFHFKKENWLKDEKFTNEEKIQEIFKLDFNKLNDSLNKISIWDKIKTNKEFIIDENIDVGFINESKKVNKILPTYNYIHNDSISLNNNFNFDISTESVSDNKKKTNEIDTHEIKANNNIDNKDYNKSTIEITQNQSNKDEDKNKNKNNIDFDIDELLDISRPVRATKENELEDELNMLLSLESDKSKNNTKINNDNINFSNNNFNDLINTPSTTNSKIDNSNNNQNMDNLQDWLDDLLS
ncbi:hypothetical protein BCR36DRAFT_348001 [Piromyces finnis]|uniref:Uncharacterized protein n=1 Tax=Piromyces finnis TaxID=1754191 RepID=A0A1Y1VGF9_9FUNG|nr:hypothetical protein BCR36DRAFT_348001 [Piromyces finnis]|eukprot:ORX54852.1 hypothetical protein BCR36DRAFT_348001 [Piromyces finnis]